MKKQTLVVNLLGAPGSGKSSLCASIFAELKSRNIDCEMALEYAKDLVWEETPHILKNQFYVFGNQLQRLWRLHGKVDLIITDSPLLNSIVYDADNDKNFEQVILKEFNKFNNLNYFIERTKPYNPNGRVQTEKESIELGKTILNKLIEHNIEFYVTVSTGNVSSLVDTIISHFHLLDPKHPFHNMFKIADKNIKGTFKDGDVIETEFEFPMMSGTDNWETNYENIYSEFVLEGIKKTNDYFLSIDAEEELRKNLAEELHKEWLETLRNDIKTLNKPMIASTAIIDQDVLIGEGTKVWHNTHISDGARIGKNCVIGANVVIGRNVFIGDNCHIGDGCLIYEGCELQDNVFFGPGVVTTNDIYPTYKDIKNWKTNGRFKQTLFCYGCSIGANSTIRCGIIIGCEAIVGCGSVVLENISGSSIVAGNPAKFIKDRKDLY